MTQAPFTILEESVPAQAPSPAIDAPTMLWVVGAVIAMILLIGLLVVLGRWLLPGRGESGRESSMSFVRSWLGLSLGGGLLVFCAVSLAVPDGTLQSVVFGGLIANVGAASAFYFASAESEQTRKDILAASGSTVLVPDVVTKTVAEARQVFGTLPLTLVYDETASANGAAIVRTAPPAHSAARSGDTVRAHFS